MIRMESFFKQLNAIGERCSFCEQLTSDTMFFDAGNNATVRVVANCCMDHARELEADDSGFQNRHRDRIEKLAEDAERDCYLEDK